MEVSMLIGVNCRKALEAVKKIANQNGGLMHTSLR